MPQTLLEQRYSPGTHRVWKPPACTVRPPVKGVSKSPRARLQLTAIPPQWSIVRSILTSPRFPVPGTPSPSRQPFYHSCPSCLGATPWPTHHPTISKALAQLNLQIIITWPAPQVFLPREMKYWGSTTISDLPRIDSSRWSRIEEQWDQIWTGREEMIHKTLRDFKPPF